MDTLEKYIAEQKRFPPHENALEEKIEFEEIRNKYLEFFEQFKVYFSQYNFSNVDSYEKIINTMNEFLAFEKDDERLDEKQILLRKDYSKLLEKRNEFISKHTGIVLTTAKRYAYEGIETSDLIGEGNIGLVTAFSKWDPDAGTRFATYAKYWVRGYIANGIRLKFRDVKIPAKKLEMVSIVTKQIYQNKHENLNEIFDKSIISEDLYRSTKNSMLKAKSLNSPINDQDKSMTCLDTLGVEDDQIEKINNKEANKLALNVINTIENERTKLTLLLNFGFTCDEPMTISEITDRYGDGVTPQALSYCKHRALEKLRKNPEILRLRESLWGY